MSRVIVCILEVWPAAIIPRGEHCTRQGAGRECWGVGWCQGSSVLRGPGQRKYLTMVNTVGDTTARARLLLCALLLTAAMRVAEAGVVTLDGVELNGYNSHI